MTDESTTPPGRQTTPPSKPGFGDPARHDFGDKPDRTSPRPVPTETEDLDDDAGEGHKGPLVDATKPGAKREPISTGRPTEGKTARTEGDKFGR